MRRAQVAGALRRDVAAEDVPALVGAAIQAAAHARESELWRRYLEVVLDGLRVS